jgi:hypothetical protein
VPETRTERLLFVLGIVLMAALAYWIVELRRDDPPRHPVATVSTPPPPTRSSSAAWIRLQLTGHTATAIAVRRGSSNGRLLYQGTLGANKTRSFAGPRLWVQLDVGDDVAATVNGRALVLPSAGGDVEVTRAGVEQPTP